MIDYKKEYGLSTNDMAVIDKNIKRANKIFVKISEKVNTIKENCESHAVKTYLNNL